MGSKEEDLPVEPVEKTVFVEDMNETELATAVSINIYGLSRKNGMWLVKDVIEQLQNIFYERRCYF